LTDSDAVSLARYHRIVETSHAGIWEIDADGTTTFANARFAAMLGYAVADMIGAPLHRFMDGAAAEITAGSIDPQRSGRHGTREFRFTHRDGHHVWTLLTASPILDGTGACQGALAMVTDMTPNPGARERLHQGERDLEVLMDNVPALISYVDQNLCYRRVNRAYERRFGIPQARIVGQPLREVLGETFFERNKHHMEAALTGKPVTYEAELPTVDGQPTAVRASYVPDRDESGDVVGFVALVTDIGELKRSERRFSAFVEAAPDAVVIVDGSGAMVLVNAETEHLFGYTREELIGKSVDMLLPKSFQAAHRGHRDGYAADPTRRLMSARQAMVALRKDGTEFSAEIALAPIETAEGVLVSAAIRDTTQRIELESQFQQAQKMESVGRLAGGVAHDFNNLLTIMLGFAEQLKRKRLANQTTSELSGIVRAAKRAADLTNQLLSFSRRQIFKPEVFSVNGLVEDNLKMLHRLIGEDIELRSHLKSDPSSVKADPGQLSQVLMNLVVNARDAMPRGGRLLIETASMEADDDLAARLSQTPGPYVRLRVRDTGTGMDPETASRVFEPFFSTKKAGHGTGLGLSTAHGIVQQFDGAMVLDTSPGQGATFDVYLPGCPEDTSAPETVTSPAETMGGDETILVVEDEDDLRDLTAEILQECGYHVLAAADGEEALMLMVNDPRHIDLVITDIVMPRMRGDELAGRLQERQSGLKVLFMSAYANDLSGQVVLEPGTNFISKPFSPTALTRTIRQLLDV